ncbi:MAG: PH domain-containing protein [Lentisphaerae bacterium]|nr:PH domain-containing protein [Lentisphaerota bacterium]MCP4102588.1 PH domain-containing protein [Lentisphaerota bacterium]
MGLLDMVFGNAKEVNKEKLLEELSPIIVEGEEIEAGFKVIRDMFVFTNKRLILVDKQGMTGKKVEYLSVPYGNIAAYAIETAGHFDLDSELKIYTRCSGMPMISKQLKKGVDIKGICQILSKHIL